jgi:hypothetical protein
MSRVVRFCFLLCDLLALIYYPACGISSWQVAVVNTTIIKRQQQEVRTISPFEIEISRRHSAFKSLPATTHVVLFLHGFLFLLLSAVAVVDCFVNWATATWFSKEIHDFIIKRQALSPISSGKWTLREQQLPPLVS